MREGEAKGGTTRHVVLLSVACGMLHVVPAVYNAVVRDYLDPFAVCKRQAQPRAQRPYVHRRLATNVLNRYRFCQAKQQLPATTTTTATHTSESSNTLVAGALPSSRIPQSAYISPPDALLCSDTISLSPLDVLPRCAGGKAGEVHPVVRSSRALLLRVPVGPAAHPVKTKKRYVCI